MGFTGAIAWHKGEDIINEAVVDKLFPDVEGPARDLIEHLVGKILGQVSEAVRGEEAACGGE